MEQWLSALRGYGSIGRAQALARSRRTASWNAGQQLIDAARPILASEAKRLQELLTKSRNHLAPLEDPFDLDLGLHRWLAAEREESYSDWLEWVVWQAKTADRIFKLFGLGRPPVELLKSEEPRVQRECCIPYGHIDQEGRLDLVIRFGTQALIVVEVKKGTADESDTDKHTGYRRWLNAQPYPQRQKHSVLLVVSAEEDLYQDFVVLSWADVCIEMRLLAINLRNEGHVAAAAMILAFVAAVEQNLLGF